ncbi:hypothetical protein GUJ93_ZPchr0005g15777 [Zizania palustris]|uniref:Uncharacterized protein n=1 Tax=Zizania palustris TaxID=103762 RepID=A0A8J5SWW0_ZIZPA|nr:hypothetical protein GUJ93_ZPchr0005g15777 [Zizania palustris]
MVDECKPTALVLSFGRSVALPSETHLFKVFSRYGPLKESKTEVQTSINTVKVVFKKRVDAERAFSIAGKYSTFGPSLHSYRLMNMPFFSEFEVALDAAQASQVDKIDEKLGNNATVEALSRETGDSVTTSGVLDEELESKANVETLAKETIEGKITVEVHIEEATTTKKIVEDKEIVEEATEVAKAIEDTTIEAPDEETKTVKDTSVEESDKKIVTVEIIKEAGMKIVAATEDIVDYTVATLKEAGMKIVAAEDIVNCATAALKEIGTKTAAAKDIMDCATTLLKKLVQKLQLLRILWIVLLSF